MPKESPLLKHNR